MFLLARLMLSAVIVMVGARTSDGATIFLANLTNNQEPGTVIPTTAGGALRPVSFGTATFTLNDAMTELAFTATIFNIDVTGSQTADVNDNLTNAHIHASSTPFVPPATAGVVWGFHGSPFNNDEPNDTIFVPFASGVGGTFGGTWNLPEGNGTTNLALQLPNIFAGRAYINFHTTQFGGGEIRGAITAVPEPTTMMLVGGGLAVLARARRRKSHASASRSAIRANNQHFAEAVEQLRRATVLHPTFAQARSRS